MTAQFRITGDHIVGEVFDGEAIIIDTVTGAYFSLAEGPAGVWSALAAGSGTVADIAATTGLAADTVAEVLAELVSAQLAATDGPPAAVTTSAHLTKYSDMEELLLLDPIHDVAPAGWPAEPPSAQ